MDAFISGGWRTPRRGEVLLGGAWRRISRAEVYRGGAWRACLSFVPPLSLNVTPYVDGATFSPFLRPASVTTTPATATPTGGAMPYRYSWSTTDGVTITSPSMATTQFRANVPANGEVSGVARVTCTDAFGSTAIGETSFYLYNQSTSQPER